MGRSGFSAAACGGVCSAELKHMPRSWLLRDIVELRVTAGTLFLPEESGRDVDPNPQRGLGLPGKKLGLSNTQCRASRKHVSQTVCLLFSFGLSKKSVNFPLRHAVKSGEQLRIASRSKTPLGPIVLEHRRQALECQVRSGGRVPHPGKSSSRRARLQYRLAPLSSIALVCPPFGRKQPSKGVSAGPVWVQPAIPLDIRPSADEARGAFVMGAQQLLSIVEMGNTGTLGLQLAVG